MNYPQRNQPALTQLSPEQVQAIAENIFPAEDTEWVGEWKMRHTPNLDGTYSSARPAHPIRTENLPANLQRITDWYQQRNTTPRLHLTTPLDARTVELLAHHGWIPTQTGYLMALDFTQPQPQPYQPDPPPPPHHVRVTVQNLPADTQGIPLPHVRITANLPYGKPSSLVGEGYCTLLPNPNDIFPYIGLSGIWTHPDHRRQYIATNIVNTAIRWGEQQNAAGAILMTLADNTPATTAYLRHGFFAHHTYQFWEHTATARR